MRALLLLTTAVALATATSASARSYDFSEDYGNAVFSYGTGVTGSSFTPFANMYPIGCAGSAYFACRSNAGLSLTVPDLPTVGVNTGVGPLQAFTFTLFDDELYVHPGADSAQDVIVRFTASETGRYRIRAFIGGIDRTLNGDGFVLTTAYNNDDGVQQ